MQTSNQILGRALSNSALLTKAPRANALELSEIERQNLLMALREADLLYQRHLRQCMSEPDPEGEGYWQNCQRNLRLLIDKVSKGIRSELQSHPRGSGK